VVEIGAGSGQWASALRLRGVPVAAFDDHSTLPDRTGGAAKAAALGGVGRGDEGVLNTNRPGGAELGRRALLLVFPPPGPMAAQCLGAYSGSTVAYVGEGRGGVNGDGTFFDALEGRATGGEGDDWDLVETHDLAPFPGGHERLYIFKRKRGGWAGWWRWR